MKSSAKEFLEAISEKKEIREYLKTYQVPEGMEKEDCLVAVAEKFGYAVTKEEMAEALRSKQEDLKAAVADARKAVLEMSVDELDSAAGGGEIGVANKDIKKKEKQHEEAQRY